MSNRHLVDIIRMKYLGKLTYSRNWIFSNYYLDGYLFRFDDRCDIINYGLITTDIGSPMKMSLGPKSDIFVTIPEYGVIIPLRELIKYNGDVYLLMEKK